MASLALVGVLAGALGVAFGVAFVAEFRGLVDFVNTGFLALAAAPDFLPGWAVLGMSAVQLMAVLAIVGLPDGVGTFLLLWAAAPEGVRVFLVVADCPPVWAFEERKERILVKDISVRCL